MSEIRKGMLVSANPIEWDKVLDAYLIRKPTPTYAALGKEFGCSAQAVGSQARENGWIALREAKTQLLLAKSQAYDIILKSIENEGPLMQQARQFVTEFFEVSQVLLQELAETKPGKLSSRINCLNSLGFAAANIGKLMDSAGLFGTAKAFGLNKREAERNGQAWGKETMQQINVTVNGMLSSASVSSDPKPAESVPVTQTAESKPIATEPGQAEPFEE